MSVPERALREALESRAGVRLAVLFGSAARGTARPRSDLDVGVILEEGLCLTELGDLDLPRSPRAFVGDHRTRRAILVCNERAPRVVEGLEVLPWRVFLARLWGGELLR